MNARPQMPALVEDALLRQLDLTEDERTTMYREAAAAILRLNDPASWPMPADEVVSLLRAADRPGFLAEQAQRALRLARRAHPNQRIRVRRRGL
jgi:hypothetical protein